MEEEKIYKHIYQLPNGNIFHIDYVSCLITWSDDPSKVNFGMQAGINGFQRIWGRELDFSWIRDEYLPMAKKSTQKPYPEYFDILEDFIKGKIFEEDGRAVNYIKDEILKDIGLEKETEVARLVLKSINFRLSPLIGRL